jgi:hypothetical protein
LDKVSQSIIVVREQFWPASQRLLPYRNILKNLKISQSKPTPKVSLSRVLRTLHSVGLLSFTTYV